MRTIQELEEARQQILTRLHPPEVAMLTLIEAGLISKRKAVREAAVEIDTWLSRHTFDVDWLRQATVCKKERIDNK